MPLVAVNVKFVCGKVVAKADHEVISTPILRSDLRM